MVAAVAVQEWVQAMGGGGSGSGGRRRRQLERWRREVPVAVFGKRVSHLRQAEDRFHGLAEAEEALGVEKARAVVLEVRVEGVRVAAGAPVPVMAVAERAQERGQAAALEQAGLVVEVARVQALAVAVEQGLAEAVVPVKNRASG